MISFVGAGIVSAGSRSCSSHPAGTWQPRRSSILSGSVAMSRSEAGSISVMPWSLCCWVQAAPGQSCGLQGHTSAGCRVLQQRDPVCSGHVKQPDRLPEMLAGAPMI